MHMWCALFVKGRLNIFRSKLWVIYRRPSDTLFVLFVVYMVPSTCIIIMLTIYWITLKQIKLFCGKVCPRNSSGIKKPFFCCCNICMFFSYNIFLNQLNLKFILWRIFRRLRICDSSFLSLLVQKISIYI